MLFQLGNIIFDGLLGPNTFNIEGDEATYAEHNLIGSKPRLQKTGDTLEQITMEIVFRAEFCNPEVSIRSLKSAKDNGTIMPLLMGNGRYRGDYVIISYPQVVDQLLADGTILQATVTVMIKEYISYDPLEQKQRAAREAAFAIGNKNPAIRSTINPVTDIKGIALSISASNQQTNALNGLVSDYDQNISKRAAIAKKIKETCDKATKDIQAMNDGLDQARAVQNRFTAIKAVAASVATSVTAIRNLYPFTSVTDLKDANTFLQGNVVIFKSVSAPLLQMVITRNPNI